MGSLVETYQVLPAVQLPPPHERPLVICTSLEGHSKRRPSSCTLLQVATSKLEEELAGRLLVFTDGSVHHDTSSATAAYLLAADPPGVPVAVACDSRAALQAVCLLERAGLSPALLIVEPTTTEASRTARKIKVIVLLAALALLLLLVGVFLAAYLYTSETTRRKVAICTTEDCTAFGLELKAAINKAVDPCHDFHAYVCGSWNDPGRWQSTEARMRAAALDSALKEVTDDQSQASKAAQFFHSCNRAEADVKENLGQFTEFRSSLGLTWPDLSTQEGKHPLDIMVNLALNWQMNFLFDMNVIIVRESPTLLVTRGHLDVAWEQDMRDPRTLQNYEIYLNDYYEILGVNGSRVGIETADLMQIEKDIVDAKVHFLYDAPRQDWFKISALDGKTPAVPAGLWLNVLTKQDKQFNWTNDNTVIVEDARILESTDNLLKNFTRERLIIGLSWIFIQTHLWAVNGVPSIRFRGTYSELTTMKEHSCMTYVDSLLGLSSASKMMTNRYGNAASRLHAYSLLHRVNENTKRLVKNLTWMDEESRRVAFLKLDRMARVLMPADSFFNKKERDALYSVFPDMNGKTFMTNLLAASEVYRQLRNHERFSDVYSVRMFPRFGREFYLYMPNVMTLAIGDLGPPLFYRNATLAIQYGGLGSFVGREMVKSLDDIGITVDAAGVRGQWLKPAAAAVHASKANCDVRPTVDRTQWRPLRVFPAVAGLEVAYASYKAAVKVDYRSLEDLRVIQLQEFEDKQVFFLAFCYSLCSKHPQTMGDACNVPVKNSPQFAEAFHCPANSPMNPPKKCTFFEN
ncbi:neprilysin-11 [Dermacentor silvarum]|uniref:neprilysin-11 n=1 Tax=Dermacentor silvarum TaxID=543639 RepID=UPI0021009C8D|nr:neprilysin-11 [Dermacentor silvarum]